MQVPQPEAPTDQEAAEYARELRRWRERRGLSKKALAELMAYDRTYFSHIEGCNLAPTEDFTRRAEDVLHAGGALLGRWQALTAARALTDPPPPPPVDRELRTVEFVAWLADHSAMNFRATYEAVAALVHRLDGESTSAHRARSHERANVSRADVAAAIATYYGSSAASDGVHSLYRASVAGTDLTLSVLVEPSWLGAAVQLGTPQERVTFRPPPLDSTTQLGDVARHAAIARLAEVEVAGTVMVNNPLYRLLALDLGLTAWPPPSPWPTSPATHSPPICWSPSWSTPSPLTAPTPSCLAGRRCVTSTCRRSPPPGCSTGATASADPPSYLPLRGRHAAIARPTTPC